MGVLSRALAALPPQTAWEPPVSMKGHLLCATHSALLGTGPKSPSVHHPAGPSHSLRARASVHPCLTPGTGPRVQQATMHGWRCEQEAEAEDNASFIYHGLIVTCRSVLTQSRFWVQPRQRRTTLLPLREERGFTQRHRAGESQRQCPAWGALWCIVKDTCARSGQ